jgi:GTP cyclohydrolase II
MQAIGLRTWRSYKKAFEDLVEWGFIEVVTKSTNQHTATVIALVKKSIAQQKHSQKHSSSTAVIDKRYKLIETIKTNTNLFSEKILLKFENFVEEQKIVSEERIQSLLELLKSYSCNRDDYALEIINKAIAAGHGSFVALTNEEKQILDWSRYVNDRTP